MAEALTLTTPIVPPSRTTYSVNRLLLDLGAAVISVTLLGSDDTRVEIEWTGAPATALMIALNKANLSTSSLQKRVLQQAVTDNKLPGGTVTGTVS
jgi:hypothetical protein